MSSERYTTFAVAGGLHPFLPISNSLGQMIARDLVKEGAKKVKILTRDAININSTLLSDFTSFGISIVQVDYTSPASLSAALADVEVVVSTLITAASLPAQLALAEACLAEDRLFLPAYFGVSPKTFEPGEVTYYKTELMQKLEEMGVKQCVLRNGFFAHYVKHMLPTVDNTLILVGPGTEPVSFISTSDLSRFVAHVLTHLSQADLINKEIKVEACRRTLLSIAQTIIFRHPSPASISIVHQSREDAEKRFEASGGTDFSASWGIRCDRGLSRITETVEELDDGLWEGWEPKAIEDFL